MGTAEQDSPSRQAIADELTRDARTDPQRVKVECQHRLSSDTPSPSEKFTLLEALGWAHYELNEIPAAAECTERAFEMLAAPIDVHDWPQAPSVVGLAYLDGFIRVALGTPQVAEDRLRSFIDNADSHDRPLLRNALIIVLGEARQLDEALFHLQLALEEADQLDDQLLKLRLLSNRAVTHLEQGRFADADRDLDHAHDIAKTLGEHRLDAIVNHNRGVVEARRGNLPAALALFERATDGFGDSGAVWIEAPALVDQAKLLLDAGLLQESLHAVRRSIQIYDQGGAGLPAFDALQLEARVQASSGAWASAAVTANKAIKRAEELQLTGMHRDTAVQLRDTCLLTAALENEALDLPEFSRTMLRDHPDLAVDIGMLLSRRKQPTEALACFDAALGDTSSTSALADLHRAVGSAESARLKRWESADRLDLIAALEGAAQQAVALGVTELRRMAARRVIQLRDIGVSAELQDGNLHSVAQILELQRQVILSPEPRLSEAERALVTQLRSIADSLTHQQLSGTARTELVRLRTSLEHQLRRDRRSHVVEESPTSIPTPRDAEPGSGVTPNRATLQMFQSGNELYTLVHEGDALRLLQPVPFDEAKAAIAACRVVLAAVASNRFPMDPQRIVDGLARSLRPLLTELEAHAEVVLIPEPRLGDVPWALVTACSIGQVASMHQWHQSALNRLESSPANIVETSTTVIAGPRLAFAEAEAARIAAAWPEAHMLKGSGATAKESIAAFGQTNLMHFAAHGTFRADNPLFSAIELVDGPLTFFDLLTAPRVPERIIFSSCSVGRAAVNSPMGLGALLFERGCNTFIANTGPANDEASAELMVALHRELRGGTSMAHALSMAQSGLVKDAPSVALFGVFGAD